MFENTNFNYLDESDIREFEEYWEEHPSILVSGRKTFYRLEKYLPENEFYRIRIILTALVRDFKLESVRYTSAIALTIYAMSIENDNNNVLDADRNIVNMELALLLEHMMTDNDEEGSSEKELFENNLEMVTKRWAEYLSAPDNFKI